MHYNCVKSIVDRLVLRDTVYATSLVYSVHKATVD